MRRRLPPTHPPTHYYFSARQERSSKELSILLMYTKTQLIIHYRCRGREVLEQSHPKVSACTTKKSSFDQKSDDAFSVSVAPEYFSQAKQILNSCIRVATQTLIAVVYIFHLYFCLFQFCTHNFSEINS